MGALVNFTNALVRLVNDNGILRTLLTEMRNEAAKSSGTPGGSAPNSTEEPLHGSAGEGEAKG